MRWFYKLFLVLGIIPKIIDQLVITQLKVVTIAYNTTVLSSLCVAKAVVVAIFVVKVNINQPFSRLKINILITDFFGLHQDMANLLNAVFGADYPGRIRPLD